MVFGTVEVLVAWDEDAGGSSPKRLADADIYYEVSMVNPRHQRTDALQGGVHSASPAMVEIGDCSEETAIIRVELKRKAGTRSKDLIIGSLQQSLAEVLKRQQGEKLPTWKGFLQPSDDSIIFPTGPPGDSTLEPPILDLRINFLPGIDLATFQRIHQLSGPSEPAPEGETESGAVYERESNFVEDADDTSPRLLCEMVHFVFKCTTMCGYYLPHKYHTGDRQSMHNTVLEIEPRATELTPLSGAEMNLCGFND
eukprot:SAG31_NODE_8193_length_1498_cov_3.713838_1_plen_253_part_10